MFGQDLNPGKGGAVSASVSEGYAASTDEAQLNLVRCLFGALGTAVVHVIYSKVGAGWTTVILSGICLAGLLLFWLVITRGSRWRAKREKAASDRQAGTSTAGGRAT